MIKVGNKYKLFRAKIFTSKKGFPYVRGSISDSEKQADGTWQVKKWYQVMLFKNADEIYEKGEFILTKISGVENQVRDYNGKRYENFLLLVDGELPKNGAQNNSGACEHGVYDHQQPSTKQDDSFVPISDEADLPF